MDERYDRNIEIDDLLQIWEWCSRRLHVRWQRRRKQRNGCYIALACALSGKASIAPMQLLKKYKKLPTPLLDRGKVIIFWETRPMSLLELCLGTYTKGSSLAKPLNSLRMPFQNNPTLDELAKTMRAREKRFGDDWFTDGHHPEREYKLLKKEMRPLYTQLRKLMADAHVTVGNLALDVLAMGWQKGEVPASALVRRTPEKLLNKAARLKLWQAAQEILSRDLEEDEMLNVLLDTLNNKLSQGTRAGIESQGHSVSDVICDFIGFDIKKSRKEITA